MNARSIVALAILALLAMLASSSLYIVNETQRAIRLQFGEVVESDIQPGLHIKVPVYNTVRLFDTRLQTLDGSPSRYLTGDRKGVIVDSFVQWKIVDVTRYYEATAGDEQASMRLIAPRVDESLRNEFGRRTLGEIVSEQRDELMSRPIEELNLALRDSMGVAIFDIRVKQIDLPSEVSNSVYERMRTERQREAREYRAQGQEQSERIRAAVDRGREVILATAERDADILRGEGDAEATGIYARAYNQDRELYSFLRSMEAYRATFNSKQDILVVSPKSDFFRYLDNAKGSK
ncbi:MAG TPA: protease modulator HflC [Marinospirillum sp.]|uniref:protease modulator HflC n=1 Tax=Marinospirillum sp. TaxID=2183934 RepID=UPI002B49F566|nr:protease modulator HflC [Marinospirillum sp.]HKM16526.1 protease modulator HflC [Marinospirillum sp.]